MPTNKLLVAAVLTLSIGSLAPSIARADAVVDWNAIASQVISAGARPGPSTLVDFAVVHAAIYDAVQSIERRYKPYCLLVPGASGSTAAATAKAARDVLVNRFQSQSGTIDTQYNNYLASHAIAIDDPGISVGAQAAAAVIALRANDGAFPAGPQVPFTGGGDPGMWRPTPSYLPGNPASFSPMAAPWLAKVTPFAIKSTSQFRAKEPPAMTSDEYTRDFNEVKAMGAGVGSSRTQEQTDAAYFWSDNTPVQWHRALRGVSTAYVHDIAESSRLFALASFAAADAIMTCWDTKIHYDFWRPVTAIQLAADDNNPNTEADPNWKPLLNTPNYPEYSSGANSVTGAMTRTLQLFFGRDDLPFTVTSNVQTLPAEKRSRTFARFSDAADQVVDARIYLGFHFRFADTAAREQGTHVAKWTFTHVLKPVDDDEEPRSPSLASSQN